MANTIPFPFGDYVRGDNTAAHQLIAEYESALGDSDHAGETDTAAYHEGRTEAFADALTLLLDVPGEAWEQYRSGVSPAKDDDEPAYVMETFEHVPGRAFEYVHEAFTHASNKASRGYTLLPASGWYVYDGPRLVRLHWWGLGAVHVQSRMVEHAELLRDVSNRMDALALQSTTSPEYLMAAAAFDLILSDVQTGTSLCSWEPMRRLVNQVITSIYCADGVLITSEWAEF
jgi:hypothetical protein